MTTVAAALRAAAALLEPVGGTGRLDATLLLEHVTGTERVAFVRDGDLPLSDEHRASFDSLVERRRGGVPTAYLIGSAGFYRRIFAVDERVLVPRPETEHLIEAALADLRGRGEVKVADIGTGSGAIAVTLAAELPDAGVFATDISRDALAVARGNAAVHGVAQRCTFLRGDLAEPLSPFGPFDCIVANLPYIPTLDVPARPDPVGFEPRLALDGGPDGLDLYRRLLAALPALLGPGGLLLLEAAPGTIEPLAELVRSAFPARFVTILADHAGLARVVSA